MNLAKFIFKKPLKFVKENFLIMRDAIKITAIKEVDEASKSNTEFIHHKMSLENRIIWVDLEMTGLDPQTCHILEMACIVTDKDLNIIAEAPNLIIHQPEHILSDMNEWSQAQHKRSGLTTASRRSVLSLTEVEDKMLSFVRLHTPEGICPLAGNSVYMDKIFLLKYMPRFAEHLHYRIIDVSTITELATRWFDFKPIKISNHRALEDIRASINKLKTYRKMFFK